MILMAAQKKKKRKKPHLLSHTRPASTAKRPSLSSQATRSLIRSHHTLQKQLRAAISNGDNAAAESLQAQLAASGGLQKYQEASIQGQSAERGGDTSRVLMGWIGELLSHARHGSGTMQGKGKMRMLEVGALKVDNACSRSGIFDVTRIDLHSRHPGIKTQDFMEMQLPLGKALDEDSFDLVSLSLVVNYVGDAAGRGDMLKRAGAFLRLGRHSGEENIVGSMFPAVFLVLPAPCVMNSRYLDEERLEDIMNFLGYVKVKRKLSQNLVYYLWQYVGRKAGQLEDVVFKKEEVRPGGQRNNFAIVVQ
ncbi:MAG: hypothetical protein Q9207_004481 [Kuettlingeria erythrocarpa]